jgi:hypothetical protein
MRWNNYGIANVDQFQYADAVNAFNEVIKLRPVYADAYTNVGLTEIAWEKYASASQSLHMALSLANDNARALYCMGLIDRRAGYSDAEIADFRVFSPRRSLAPVHFLVFAMFLFSLFSIAPSSRAQEHCPWLNAATAAGAVDAAVTVTVTRPTGKSTDAVCEFTHRQGSDSRQLRVQVEVMTDPSASFSSYLARCGTGATPLKAIGNEAVVCSVPVKNAQAEQVVGRVRDQAFIILLRSNDKSIAESTLRDRVRRIAETVAGNLF